MHAQGALSGSSSIAAVVAHHLLVVQVGLGKGVAGEGENGKGGIE